MFGVEGRKPEPRTARLKCRDDLADVVADQAEAGVPSVLLDDCNKEARSGLTFQSFAEDPCFEIGDLKNKLCEGLATV